MRLFIFGILFAALAQPALALAESLPSAASEPTYADLADLTVPAQVAAHVRIRHAIPLEDAAAASVPPGKTRFYVEAEVLSLIRAPHALPAEVRYLVDLAHDPSGEAPRLRRKSEHIVLAATVPNRPDELRLVAPDAQLAWTPERAERVRSILREAAAADAAPRITGIGRAFHVQGTLPGESETQLFLLAANERPVSLTVLRRPGQAPHWAVALGEIIDEAAEPPAPESLLWYRLACGLPRSLPPQSLAQAEPESAAIRADYALVLEQLGPCTRTRAQS